MILGFKEYFDKQKTKPTHFREKILAGAGYVWSNELQKPVKLYQPLEGPTNVSQFIPKITTIREGHRWKAGDLMHMAYGVRTKNYCQFNKGIPELERVKSVQEIEIKWRTWHLKPLEGFTKGGDYREPIIEIDGKNCNWVILDKLAMNDGFDSLDDFLSWFSKDFEGQIIHWTDKRY